MMITTVQMITNQLDGIISLLKTSNIIVINALIESGFVTTEILLAAIKEYVVRYGNFEDVPFVVALANKFDHIEDQALLDCLINQMSNNKFDYRQWNTEMIRTFMKLVDMGGKMATHNLMCLPYDAVSYYSDNNEFHVDSWTITSISPYTTDPKVADLSYEMLATDIHRFSSYDLINCVISCISSNTVKQIMVQEIYDRSLMDMLMVHLVCCKGYLDNIPFLDEHISECKYHVEILFFQQLSKIYYYPNREWQTDDLVSLAIFYRSDKKISDTLGIILSHPFKHTDDDFQCVLAKIRMLMEMYN